MPRYSDIRRMIGAGLQKQRKGAGWRSAREFAESIGMSVGTYTDYEQGRGSISLEKACLIADALHCTLDDLVDRPRESAVPRDEVDLLSAYRRLGARDRDELVELAEFKAARADSLALEEGGAASA